LIGYMGLTVLKIVVILIIVGGLAVVGIAFGAIRFVKAYNRKKYPAGLDKSAKGNEKLGECSRCGKERIIVAVTEHMCGSCYSAMRTKKD